MCLSTVDVRHKPAKRGKVLAWKIFAKQGGRLFAWCRNVGPYDEGTTYCSSNEELGRRADAKYRSGFHCYPTRLDARREGLGGIIRRVEVDRVVAEGWQYGSRVIVAKEMRILPKPKRGGKR